MKQLQHVVWSKGVFLTPQHLQTQDRYMEDLLQFQLESCGSNLYGFAGLQVDFKEQPEGQFSLLSAKGILPDGLLFDIPYPDEAPPSVKIKGAFRADQDNVDIFLAVPKQLNMMRTEGEPASTGANVGPEPDAKVRFLTKTLRVRDENSGTSEKPIEMARKNLKLLVGKNHEGFTTMQVARVVKTDPNRFELDTSFIPPLLDVQASDSLRQIVRGLAETLAARSSTLAAGRRQKNQSLAEFTAADIANFWLQYTVNQHLPIFRHLSQRGTVHPEQLFSTMLGLAGTLTTFSTEIAPGDLPDYQHDEPGKCIRALERKIRILLNTVVPANFVAIPLKLVQPSIYAAAVEQETYRRPRDWYLAVSADKNDEFLIDRVPKMIKVDSLGHVDQLIRQALPGLELAHALVPPSEIPIKLKYKYFKLTLDGKAWERIQHSRNVGVYVPHDLPNPELELIILLHPDR